MDTPFDVLGVIDATGSKLVAALYLPTGLSRAAGTTVNGGSVTGTITLAADATPIYGGLVESPAGSGQFTLRSTISGTVLPDCVNAPYLIEVRAVDAGTDMASYTAIALAFAASTTIRYSLGPAQYGEGYLFGGIWRLPAAGGGAAGSGADSIVITWTNSTTSLPVQTGELWITSDANGSTVVAGTLLTNGTGRATFLLNNGGTYYVWGTKDGVRPLAGTAFVASASVGNAFSSASATAGSTGHYSSQQRLIDRYGAPLVAQACGGTIDANLIDRKLSDADGRINAAYAGKMYVVPLATSTGGVPSLIAQVADILSWDALYHARGVNDKPVKKGDVNLENKFSSEVRQAYAMIGQSLLPTNLMPDAVIDTTMSLSPVLL